MGYITRAVSRTPRPEESKRLLLSRNTTFAVAGP